MIDEYAPYQRAAKCEPIYVALTDPSPGGELLEKRRGVYLFRQMVLEKFGGAGAGVGRACAEEIDLHNESRAWDWSPATDAAADRLIAELLATDDEGNAHALARRYGLRNVIWQRRIWTAPAADFAPYAGRNAHLTHVHFDWSWDGALGRTSAYLEGEEGVSPWPFRGGGTPSAGDLGDD
jgi:hypothetical protein